MTNIRREAKQFLGDTPRQMRSYRRAYKDALREGRWEDARKAILDGFGLLPYEREETRNEVREITPDKRAWRSQWLLIGAKNGDKISPRIQAYVKKVKWGNFNYHNTYDSSEVEAEVLPSGRVVYFHPTVERCVKIKAHL